MYWDHGYGMGPGWIWAVLLGLVVLGALAALVVLVVKAASGSNAPTPPHHAPGSAQRPARAIAEERLARGELTPDEFREIVRALEDGAGRSG